jgi:4-amino-4-deoxy-L-arabinose transferase-like glycosyltransferase
VTAKHVILIAAVVLALRVPFLRQPIQGDDPYYLYGAEHAQIEPLHPNHARYLFQGDLVDMRGHPHPPLNSWMLGALLTVFGDVREARFHVAYIVFSLIAAISMFSLARRFCDHPFAATMLFAAVPAFVVNGTSLEADLPFLAFWMASIALCVEGLEMWAALAAALAGLTAYQAIFLTPILAAYVWSKRRERKLANMRVWVPVLAAPVTLAAWQLWERATTGAIPATMLAGYLQTYGLEALVSKIRNAAALAVHSAWIISPLLVIAAFARGRWRTLTACAAATGAALHDPNPLFWISIGCSVLLLIHVVEQRDFLSAWIVIFFGGAIAVFFAGSARYLLPIAAPLAILTARRVPARLLWIGFALQMALSLALASANYQHWNAYREFAASRPKNGQRTWANAEWGLRYYLESTGALPLPKNQALQPHEIVVSSALAPAVAIHAPMAVIAEAEVTPSIPLRLISLSGRSAYSSAARGLLPFEISTVPLDRVRAEVVLERNAELSYLDPRDPKSASQILSGLYPDGWMTEQASVLLKVPEKPAPLSAEIFIPPQTLARRVTLAVSGRVVAEETFPKPGLYSLAAPLDVRAPAVTVTISTDRTFSAPGDQRKLGVVLRGIGFR